MLGLANSITAGGLPATDFLLTSVSGLQLWLKNDTGITTATGISQWEDQSGNDNHAAQSTGSNQPALLNGGAHFDGSDDFFDITEIELDLFHVFIIVTLDAENNETLLGGTNQNFFRLAHGGSTSSGRFRATSSSGNVNITFSAAVEDDTKMLFELIRNGDNELLSIKDGTTLSTDSSDGGTFPWKPTQIGCQADGGTPLDGKIDELVIYNAVLSGDDLTNVRRDINTRNGL